MTKKSSKSFAHANSNERLDHMKARDNRAKDKRHYLDEYYEDLDLDSKDNLQLLRKK